MQFLVKAAHLGCLSEPHCVLELRDAASLFLEKTRRFSWPFQRVCCLLLVLAAMQYLLVDGREHDGTLFSGTTLESSLGVRGSVVDGQASMERSVLARHGLCTGQVFFQEKKGTSESTAVHSSGPSVAVRGSVVELAADASTGEFSVPFEEGKTCEVTFALD